MQFSTMRGWLMGAALLAGAACSSSDSDGQLAGAGGGAAASGNAGGAASGTAGGAATSGPAGGSYACPDGSATTSLVTPRVTLVLDGSCSMSTDYPSSGDQSSTRCTRNPDSRWAALRGALLDAPSGVVTRLQRFVEFGLVVFGTEPECPLTATPIDAALDNGAAIEGALGNTPPGMFTPTGAALEWVYENMIKDDAPDSDLGPQIVILATDGEPNSCDDPETDYQPSLNALMASKQKPVTTYVISLASATGEFHDHLQQLADIGSPTGSGHLYEPGSPEELSADLELLIGGAIDCELALNGEVVAGTECQGTVTLDGQTLGCNDPNGWALSDSRHIRLQGDACETYKSGDEHHALTADFPCDSFRPD